MLSTYAERIKYAMELQDIKQAELVNRTGLNKGAISSYINGRYKPKQGAIYLLAKALNVSEIWLMGLTDDIHAKGTLSKNYDEDNPRLYIKHVVPLCKIKELNLDERVLDTAFNTVLVPATSNIDKEDLDYKKTFEKMFSDDILLSVLLKTAALNKDNKKKVNDYLDLLLMSEDK